MEYVVMVAGIAVFVLSSIPLAILGFRGGIWFRNYTMPSYFSSRNMMETFYKKVGMQFGPPLVGIFLGLATSYYLAMGASLGLGAALGLSKPAATSPKLAEAAGPAARAEDVQPEASGQEQLDASPPSELPSENGDSSTASVDPQADSTQYRADYPSVESPTASGAMIANPDWMRRPTSAEFNDYYPTEARVAGLSGQATIACGVSRSGSLDNCVVQSESPANEGFGYAASAMAPLFRMRPNDRDGQPTAGGRVIIPIRFQLPN